MYKEIEQLSKQLKSPKNTEIEEKEIKEKIEALHTKIKSLYTLPNKNGEPVPIKKVRVAEEMGNAQQLKSTIKQYVNPRNNHHVLIYKDENGSLKEDVVSFWTVVERIPQNQEVFQLPVDGTSIVTNLQINDMFVLGLKEEEVDWENPDYDLLKEHLYRVQKFTSGDYYFRIARTSTINNDCERIYIKNFLNGKTGWFTHNPIKVKISVLGKIIKI